VERTCDPKKKKKIAGPAEFLGQEAESKECLLLRHAAKGDFVVLHSTDIFAP
jgi:hypothetical protein